MINIAQPILKDEEKQAILDVIDSGTLVQGPKVAEFEHGFAELVGTGHAIATSSGTTALVISLSAMGIKPGHEVITTPFSFIATATCIRACGATPVFVDVDPMTFNIEPERVAEAVSGKTAAILPVHLYGLSAEMDELSELAEKNDIGIVEDACQAHGARYGDRHVGSIGDTGCFSFYPTKNMTTGEGGMITTSNEELANSCRLIRNHGQESRYSYALLGYNYRMTEFAGALGCIQLSRLEEFNEIRRNNARLLTELLGDAVETPYMPGDRVHVFHQYTIKLSSQKVRDQLQNHLAGKKIGAVVYYPVGLHQIDFLHGKVVGNLDNTMQLTKTVLSLPVHPGLNEEHIKLIAEEVQKGIKN